MRRISLLTFISLVFVSGAVMAWADDRDDRDQEVEARCRFMGGPKGEETCEARIRKCPTVPVVDVPGAVPGPAQDDHNQCRDRLVVRCEGNEIYDDGFRLEDEGNFIRIIGKDHSLDPGHDGDHGHDGDRDRDHDRDHDRTEIVLRKNDGFPDTVSAWLRFDDARLRGACEIDRVRHRDRDHGDDQF